MKSLYRNNVKINLSRAVSTNSAQIFDPNTILTAYFTIPAFGGTSQYLTDIIFLPVVDNEGNIVTSNI